MSRPWHWWMKFGTDAGALYKKPWAIARMVRRYLSRKAGGE